MKIHIPNFLKTMNEQYIEGEFDNDYLYFNLDSFGVYTDEDIERFMFLLNITIELSNGLHLFDISCKTMVRYYNYLENNTERYWKDKAKIENNTERYEEDDENIKNDTAFPISFLKSK